MSCDSIQAQAAAVVGWVRLRQGVSEEADNGCLACAPEGLGGWLINGVAAVAMQQAVEAAKGCSLQWLLSEGRQQGCGGGGRKHRQQAPSWPATVRSSGARAKAGCRSCGDGSRECREGSRERRETTTGVGQRQGAA